MTKRELEARIATYERSIGRMTSKRDDLNYKIQRAIIKLAELRELKRNVEKAIRESS